MTDQIPADKVRKIATAMRDAMRRVEDDYPDGEFLMDMSDYIRDIDALLPAPPRPTLADMTPEERAACQWMQCEVTGFQGQWVLATLCDDDDEAGLIAACGEICWSSPAQVTPRPDLPRMAWPGDQKPAPALPDGFRLAEHPDYGRVIVTTPDPGCDGDVYFVYPETVLSLGFNSGWCDPDELTYLDQEADTPTGPDTLAVGTVIESADDPRIAALPVGSVLEDRVYGGFYDATKTDTGEWAGLGYKPHAGMGTKWGPWTVRRIGKGADQ